MTIKELIKALKKQPDQNLEVYKYMGDNELEFLEEEDLADIMLPIENAEGEQSECKIFVVNFESLLYDGAEIENELE